MARLKGAHGPDQPTSLGGQKAAIRFKIAWT